MYSSFIIASWLFASSPGVKKYCLVWLLASNKGKFTPSSSKPNSSLIKLTAAFAYKCTAAVLAVISKSLLPRALFLALIWIKLHHNSLRNFPTSGLVIDSPSIELCQLVLGSIDPLNVAKGPQVNFSK